MLLSIPCRLAKSDLEAIWVAKLRGKRNRDVCVINDVQYAPGELVFVGPSAALDGGLYVGWIEFDLSEDDGAERADFSLVPGLKEKKSVK
jgi:hypothetical protein